MTRSKFLKTATVAPFVITFPSLAKKQGGLTHKEFSDLGEKGKHVSENAPLDLNWFIDSLKIKGQKEYFESVIFNWGNLFSSLTIEYLTFSGIFLEVKTVAPSRNTYVNNIIDKARRHPSVSIYLLNRAGFFVAASNFNGLKINGREVRVFT